MQMQIKMNIVLVGVMLTVAFKVTFSLNILCMVPFPSKSHFLVVARLLRILADKGHNVTVISHYPWENSPLNYRDIDIGNTDKFFQKLEPFRSFENINTNKLSMYLTPQTVALSSYAVCDLTYQSKSVQNFLKEKQNFDVILTEDFFVECLWPLVQKYDCPVVRYVPHALGPWNGKPLGNPLGSAYLSNVWFVQNNGKSFFGRIERCILNFIHNLYFDFCIVPKQMEIAKKYLTAEETNFDTASFKESLQLVNSHYSLNSPRPLVPNIIEVGGIHIEGSRKLPKDIEKWINESTHGVIYFSLGSVIKGHTMLEEKRKAFINAFKRLPQRVIWKWENDTMEGKTDNILIGKWMPQFDILSHPNVKAFISHGGLLGTMEAVHCGVPMMVMPQFGDQHTNAKALESVGGGVVLYMDDANEDLIYESLKKILEPSFQSQTKELSRRFRDRPMPPLETAIYWVEYVARHKGAHFMKTAAVNMPFYQYYLLDVIAFIVLVLTVFLYVIFVSLRSVLRIFGFFPKKIHKVKKS